MLEKPTSIILTSLFTAIWSVLKLPFSVGDGDSEWAEGNDRGGCA